MLLRSHYRAGIPSPGHYEHILRGSAFTAFWPLDRAVPGKLLSSKYGGRETDAIPRICAGEEDAGPIARLSPSERFHWLVSPRSTMIQVSPVHGGFCDDPAAQLGRAGLSPTPRVGL